MINSTIDTCVEKDEEDGREDVDENDCFNHRNQYVAVGETHLGGVSQAKCFVTVRYFHGPQLKKMRKIEDGYENEKDGDCDVSSIGWNVPEK